VLHKLIQVRCRRCRRPRWAAVVVAAVAPVAVGCSAHTGQVRPDSASPADGPGANAAATVSPGAVAVSPAGVTTKIDVPARSTEDEYFQACHAAKVWMQGRALDRQVLTEAYLAAVQAPGAVGPGTWNLAWAALPLARQAAVIVAAQAAARDECG
jgi:Putative lipoprotein LpqV